ncbi:MAG: hypothetical protein GY797_27065 [Deltaproteobacteria bacterium]|nr:hypothetical protein [Deltaproteobacteria bacterium]
MESSWERTQRFNSSSNYARFIKEYPDSPYVSEARSRIENLAYELSAKRDQVSGYKKFIEEYPTGELNEQARDRMAVLLKEEEDSAYVKAKEKDSIKNYESFLEKYPASGHAHDVKIAIARIKRQKEDELYQAASSMMSYDKLVQYESQYPNGRYITQVHESLNRFHWQSLDNHRLLRWEKLGIGTPLSSYGLTEKIRSKTNTFGIGGNVYGTYIVGGAVTRIDEIIFVQNGANAFGKMTVEPTQFTIVTAKNKLVKSAADRQGERILLIDQKIVVAVGSLIVLDYIKSTGDVNCLSAVGKSDGISYFTKFCGGLSDVGGINLFGTICRTGSVDVTIEGLLLAKGTEVLEMR